MQPFTSDATGTDEPLETSTVETSPVETSTRALPAPTVWVGTNFWSSAGGPRMWARYDGDVVRQELEVLAGLGLNVTRSFCYWPDFMPAPETLDDEVMERFADFLDLHIDVGMHTVPTFLVGHMSGENWDPAWRGGRDLYRDVWLVAQQAWFVAEIARRCARHPAIAGWLLSNEMPIYGRNGEEEVVTPWARLLVQALRSAGAVQPVGTGDGAWGIETSGKQNGFSLRRLAPIVDFIGPHVYGADNDPVRQSLSAAFACELSGSFGKPVILEEFGVSSDMASGPNAASYYRQVLYSSLLAGARGWLAWNNCDYDNLAGQSPYSHHPFEMHFGITDHARRPKPQALELGRFAALAHQLSDLGWQRVSGEAAIVVPEHFERSEPSWSPVPIEGVRANLLQSYIAAREADLPVALVREMDMVRQVGLTSEAHLERDNADVERDNADGPGHTPETKLYLLPCAKLITAPGLQVMLGLARAGATVYASYFAGTGPVQNGPWLPWLDQVFGVRHELRYGVNDQISDDIVTLEMVQDFGSLGAAARLNFTAAGEGPGRSYLPVEPAGAEVLAVDDYDRPALLRNRVGDGWTVLCTYPLEHLAALQPEVNPEPTWELYAALAEAAGVSRPVRATDPRLAVGAIDLSPGTDQQRRTYLVINLSPEVVASPLIAPGLDVRVSAATASQGAQPGEGAEGAPVPEEGAKADADAAPDSPTGEDNAGIEGPGIEGNAVEGTVVEDAVVEDAGQEVSDVPVTIELGPYQVVMLDATALPNNGTPGATGEADVTGETELTA